MRAIDSLANMTYDDKHNRRQITAAANPPKSTAPENLSATFPYKLNNS
jgi:hypothetical protein